MDAWRVVGRPAPIGPAERLTYETFVQGSYVNETNIRGDSDVDLVVEMKMPLEQQIERLKPFERKRFDDRYEDSRYDRHDFDLDVLVALRESFWASKHNKCIDIKDWDSALRLPADILPTLEHREYSGFSASGRETYRSGVVFRDRHGTEIISYPRQHLRNGRRKDRDEIYPLFDKEVPKGLKSFVTELQQVFLR